MKGFELLKQRFFDFAEKECKGVSALYYKLSIQIANDVELLNLASSTRKGQPFPNMFLAAVHYLLLRNQEEPLARYYPSIQPSHHTEVPFDLFKAFCLEHQEEIRKIASTRIVQTNVIGRCSYLMPILSKIMAEENKPTTIIDIGTSAGLTLNFDKYEYWYNEKKVFGESNVLVKSTTIESPIPEIYPISQPIQKIGIDQKIIDPTDKEEIWWLKALVWPDQPDRFTAMEEALRLTELKNISFIQANTVPDFEAEIRKVDKSQTLIIYATHVLYQFTQAQKDEFYAMLEKVGQDRDLYFLSAEGIKALTEKYHSKETVIELISYKSQQKATRFVAETNGHGNWIRWL